jgi:hypothetical protein
MDVAIGPNRATGSPPVGRILLNWIEDMLMWDLKRLPSKRFLGYAGIWYLGKRLIEVH